MECTAVSRVNTIRKGARARTISLDGPIALTISGRLAARVRALAREAGASSVESYCDELLETFVVEQRSGKRRPVDPAWYTAQQDGDVW